MSDEMTSGEAPAEEPGGGTKGSLLLSRRYRSTYRSRSRSVQSRKTSLESRSRVPSAWALGRREEAREASRSCSRTRPRSLSRVCRGAMKGGWTGGEEERSIAAASAAACRQRRWRVSRYLGRREPLSGRSACQTQVRVGLACLGSQIWRG